MLNVDLDKTKVISSGSVCKGGRCKSRLLPQPDAVCGSSLSAVEIEGIFGDVHGRSHVKTGLKSIPGAIRKNGRYWHSGFRIKIGRQ
jgi:hypothetical protein